MIFKKSIRLDNIAAVSCACTHDWKNRLNILHGGTIASMVDLGGSLAVASRGLFATGVSTDLNVTYLSSGGKIGDLIKAEVTCDKCKS